MSNSRKTLGIALMLVGVVFIIMHYFIVSSDGVKTYDFWDFVIPTPPMWLSYLPYIGGMLGFFYESLSVHGLIGILGTMFTLGLGYRLYSEKVTYKSVSHPISEHPFSTGIEHKDKSTHMRFVIGTDPNGNELAVPLNELPNLLIAGETGSGKSVFLHRLITYILSTYTQDEVQLVLIDHKMLEFTTYNATDLMMLPVVNSVEDANNALDTLQKEAQKRQELFSNQNVEGFYEYNKTASKKIPLIILISDEVSDQILSGGQPIIDQYIQLVTNSEVLGMKFILATQIPREAVYTDQLKESFPARITFKTHSSPYLRPLIDNVDSNKLEFRGSMILSLSGVGVKYLQGEYQSYEEVTDLVKSLTKAH